MTNPATPLDFLQGASHEDFLAAMRNFTHGISPEEYLECIQGEFRFFLWELWRDRGLHRVAPLDRAELDIAHYSQHGPKKRGVLAPRGVGKTNFGTAAMTCFRLRRDRDRRILIPSKNEDAMKETVALIKAWINSVWFLQDLDNQEGKAYNAAGKNCRDTTLYFDVAGCKENKQPSVKCIGNSGMLEGNRAHSIYPDDVETKGNTKTIEGRSELARLLKEYVNILYPDLPDQEDPDNELLRPLDPTEVCFYGTIKHEDTVYSKLDNAKDGKGRKVYWFRTWTLAYPTAEEIRGALGIAPMLTDDLALGRAGAGDPVFPRRFGTDNILEKQAEGYQEYAMEHQLQVTLAQTNRYPLRLGDLIVMDVHRDIAPPTVVWGTQDSSGSTIRDDISCISLNANDGLRRPVVISKADEWRPYHGTKAFIDPAGKGADETGLSIVSALGSLLFVKCCTGLPGGVGTDDMLAIIRLLKLHNATDVYIEGNIDTFGTYIQTFEAVIRTQFEEPSPANPAGWKASVTAHHSHGQKEVRIIDNLEPVISSHRLIFDTKAIAQKPNEEPHQTAQYQLSRMTRERNCIKLNDRADSLANCIYQWNHILRNDSASAHARFSEDAAIDAAKAMLDKLSGFSSDLPGFVPDSPSFLTRR